MLKTAGRLETFVRTATASFAADLGTEMRKTGMALLVSNRGVSVTTDLGVTASRDI